MTIIHIHEFSTGILVDGTDDNGEWRSRGFSGEYMNSTLAKIPRPVQLAIKNREFAVSEGASSQNPAIIGREVEYHGEAWSVIAVVTRGIDERGRCVSLYRYFLCQERGKLPDLVSWYMKNGMPTFNPSDHKQVGYPTEYDDTETQINDYIPHELDGIWEGKTPIIIPQKQTPYPALIIHKIASKTDPARYNELISWAWNVEDLEKPNRFLVIHPANQKAEGRIKSQIASIPQLTTPLKETSVKIAVRNSCRTGNFQNNLVTIEKALNNPKIQQDYTTFWGDIFENEGSEYAYQQGIYDKYKVRLLTLQAIICPEKLPDFVAWIMKKEKDYYPISQSFQQEILRVILNQDSVISDKITKGINILILNVIDRPKLTEVAAKFLSDETGLWGKIYKTYISLGLKNETSIFGLPVKREIPKQQWTGREIKETAIFLLSSVFRGGGASGCFIAIIYFLLIFTLGGFFLQRLLNLANLSVPGLPGGSNNSESPIIKEAIESFPTTKGSLLQIQQDLKQTTRADASKPNKNEIDEAISKILDPNNSFELKTLNKPEDNKDKEKWILSILSYQLYKVTPSNSDDFDGIIDKDGTTYQALKCNLLQNMQLQATQATADNCKKLGFSQVKVAKTRASSSTSAPTPTTTTTEEEAIRKAVSEFDKPQKTKSSLETLVKELDLDEAFSVSSSYNVINVLDPNNQFRISLSRMTEPADKEAWVKAILQYQESLKSRLKKEQSINIDVDGVINYERNTYNLLKCDVAAQLGQTLSDTPICGKVKPIIDSSTPPPG
ncbi:hypothetical protein [Microcystis aeruginosa]|uniref:hypothetical protein n=1 Tax=Microcystis aeruginosa TaxID=1126 RepID=UPI00287FB25C|nr:hypothetical protein [Microcystis aeruginosa]WNF14074.1 hypothetical protein RKE53_18695 [Microcystis aeruginosa NRERC-214]